MLNSRQEAFKNNLLKGMTQKDAYIAAGYSSNPQTAEVNASNLLRNPKFRVEYEKAIEKAANKAEATKERVLREECRLAYSDLLGLFDDGGSLVRPQDIPEDVRRSISSIKVTEKWDPTTEKMCHVYEYRFWDKGRALERISKHLGLYAEDNKQKQDPVLLAALLSSFPDDFAAKVRESLAEKVTL